MTLEGEIASLEVCFSYSDYNEVLHRNESEVINLQSDMEWDNEDVDVDVDVISEQEQPCKHKRGQYRYYSEVYKQRFW